MKKRLFIAVDISDEARERAAAYIDSLKHQFPDIRISWGRAQKLHLTLKFLGDVEESRIDPIINTIERAAEDVRKFSIQLSGTGVFPSLRKAKVFWLGILDPGKQLTEIATRIEDQCGRLGFPAEDWHFSPHLTIGRVRDPRTAKELAVAHLADEFGPIAFEVDEIVLYQSELRATGSLYSRLAVAQLRD